MISFMISFEPAQIFRDPGVAQSAGHALLVP